MNQKIILTAVVMGLLMTAVSVPARAQMQGATTGAKKVEVGNSICPVSGEKVGQKGKLVQVEYKGKFYNLCCNLCKKDFLKNPEKYTGIADTQAAKDKSEGTAVTH